MIKQSANEIAETKATLKRLRELTKLGKWEDRHAQLWRNAEQIRNYLYSFTLVGSDEAFVERYVNDALPRFFHTIDFMKGHVPTRVLEIGANPYLFTVLLKQLFDIELTLTNFFSCSVYDSQVTSGKQVVRNEPYDEEHTFDYLTLNVELSEYPFSDGQFDLVFFCEVLEHIVVDPLQSFKKLYRITRPGGHLLLTTPNAVRLINVAHMLAGKNFFDRYYPHNGVYGRHNREFTLSEVESILKLEGFEIENATTLDRYNYDQADMYVDSYEEQTKLPWSGSQLRGMLKTLGVNTENRGDNLYILARRPG